MAYDESGQDPAGGARQRQGSDSPSLSLKDIPSHPSRKVTFTSSSDGEGSLRRKRWLAYSLRPLFLLTLSTLSLLTFTAIEVLRQFSNRNQGLAFFPDSNLIPGWIYFLYNFLPPILAVPYSWLWNLLSTDAKRLESYFHLDRPGVPVSVLFVDYTFDSPVLAPIRAFKRRHWPIVWIGPVSLLVSLVFTASQGGLFGLSQVAIPSEVSFSSWSQLLDINDQANAISTNWTDRESLVLSSQKTPLPPYVTTNYSVAPFSLTSGEAENETWTADTQLFWAEPECHQLVIGSIEVAEPLNDTLQQESSDPLDGFGVKNKLFELKLKNLTTTGSNCDLSAAIQWKAEFAPSGQQNFLPIWDNVTQPLQSSIDEYPIAQDMIFRGNAWGALFGECPDFDWFGAIIRYTWFDEQQPPQPNSLSVFASASSPQYIQFSVVATVCQATYFTANGTVTVEGSNRTVASATATDSGTVLSAQQFQPINFETALQFESSISDPSFENATFEVPIGSFDVFYGSHSTFATLVLKNATNTTELLEGTELSTRVQAAWQLGFALAFQDAFDADAAPSQLKGSTVTNSIAITVTEEFAFLSESLLLICTVAALATMVVYWRRDNFLQSDPDSLAAMCALATDLLTEKTLGEFATEGFDQASTVALKEDLSTAHLLPTPDGHLLTYHTQDAPSDGRKQIKRSPTFGQRSSDRNSFFLTIPGWTLSFLSLALLLGGGMFAFIWSYKEGGFSFLADLNSFYSQLLYSFLPTLTATLVDICFQQVHRDMGVLEAFVRLSQGYQTAADSMTLQYFSRPSIVTVVPAFLRRHWFMAFLSAVAISTSVLNIASAALFSQAFTSVPIAAGFASAFSPATLPSSWLDTTLDMSRALEAVQNNVVANGSQLPWTDEQYSYLPLALPDGITDPTATFSAPTVAIGVTMSCSVIPMRPNTTEDDSGVVTEVGTVDGADTNRTAFWTVPDPEEPNRDIRCSVEWQDVPGEAGNSSFFAAPLTIGGDPTFSADQSDDGTACVRSALFLLSTDAPDNSTTVENDFAWACTPALQVRDASINFDQSGQIISSSIQPATSDQTQNFFTNQSVFLGEFSNNFGSFSLDSMTQIPGGSADWSTLLTLALQNNSLDETTFDVVSGEVYTRVFAAFFSIYRDELMAIPNPASNGATTKLRLRSPSPSVQGSVMTQQARIVPSTPLFVLTICLLIIYLIAAVLVLVLRRQRYSGPRAPRTLGAVLPWIARSRLLRDMRGLHGLSSSERERYLERGGWRFGYGWFLDESSTWRLGLEYEPYVKRKVDEGPGMPVPKTVVNGYYTGSLATDSPATTERQSPRMVNEKRMGLRVDTLAVTRAQSIEVSPL